MRKMYCVIALVAVACGTPTAAPDGAVAPSLSITSCQATPDTAFVDRSYSADFGNYVEADQCGNLIIDGVVAISSIDADAAGVPAQLANESGFQSIVLAPVATA